MEEVAFVTFNVRDVHVVVQGIGAADIGIGIAYLGACARVVRAYRCPLAATARSDSIDDPTTDRLCCCALVFETWTAHVTAGSDRFVTTNSQPANRPFPHLKPLTVRAAFSDMMGSGLVLRIVKESVRAHPSWPSMPARFGSHVLIALAAASSSWRGGDAEWAVRVGRHGGRGAASLQGPLQLQPARHPPVSPPYLSRQ